MNLKKDLKKKRNKAPGHDDLDVNIITSVNELIKNHW